MNIPLDIQIQQWKQLPRVSQEGQAEGPTLNDLGVGSTNEAKVSFEDGGKAAESFAKSIKTVEEAFGGYNRAAAQGFKEIQNLQQGLIDASEATFVFEKRNETLIRSLGINNNTAQTFGTILDELSSRYRLNSDDLKKYTQDVNQFFAGTSGFLVQGIKDGNAFADQMIVINDALQTQYGLTAEQANQFQTYAMSAGVSGTALFKSFQSAANQIEAATGQTGVLAEMISAIAQVSTQNQLTFGQYPGQLALAAVQANRLGTSFDNIAAAGEKSLDIESSVASELEYQLLTGTKLEKNGQNLLNNLRQATVAGDATDLAKAYGDILDVMGPLSEMSLLEQDAAAKTLGISRQELAVQYQRREARAEMLEQLGQMQGSDNLIDLFDQGQFTELEKNLEKIGADNELIDAINSLQDPDTALKTSQDRLTDATNSLTAQIVAIYGANGTIEELATSRDKFTQELTGGTSEVINKLSEFAKRTGTGEYIKEAASVVGDALFINDLTKNTKLLSDNAKIAATGLGALVSVFARFENKFPGIFGNPDSPLNRKT